MATGDQADFTRRILALLPNQWTGDVANSADGVVYAMATSHAFQLAYLYSTYLTLIQDTRLETAVGPALDAISTDYYGNQLPRRTGEPDSIFRVRIQAEFFIARGTRPGIIAALTTLTGMPPIVFEPWNAQDTKGWSTPQMGYGVPSCAWGTNAPYTAFIWVQRPLRVAAGIQGAPGWGSFRWGWSTNTSQWVPQGWLPSSIVDADIYALVSRNHALGTNIIVNPY